MIGGALDGMNPNRELIKEGKITKVSARDGGHLERHLFLVIRLFAHVLNFWYMVNRDIETCYYETTSLYVSSEY